MSTIHTAMTGKTDSLIDAVRESEEQRELEQRKEAYMANRFNELKAKDHYTHPDHPDYMRMVVHQMD